MKNKLIMTYSLTSSFLQCEQKWWYMYVKSIEPRLWKEPYVMGNMFQYGIFLLMKTKKLSVAQAEMEIYLRKYLNDLRKEFRVSADDEKKFVEMRMMLKGMLYGYYRKHSRDIEVEKYIANEKEEVYGFGDAEFRIKMDNILKYAGQLYLHEGKAWNYLHSDRVNNAIRSLQVATYFYFHNEFGSGKKFAGIVFDAVQKPSIKKRGGESYKGYLNRLEQYYSGADSHSKFYKEVFDKPAIDFEQWLHSMKKARNRMLKIVGGVKPVRTFVDCSLCDYQTLCYDGETRENLAYYRPNKYIADLRKGK